MLEMLQEMARLLAGKAHLRRLGSLFSETVLLQVGEEEYYLQFDRGIVTSIRAEISRKTPWRFALKTDRAALDAFWRDLPEPGYHDIFGLVKMGRARIDGDILALVKNLRFFKEFMALGREVKNR
ncbi:hypothetical protein [Roseibium aggregatum]|nr:hypothetical protein [Roseibium aggregatum]